MPGRGGARRQPVPPSPECSAARPLPPSPRRSRGSLLHADPGRRRRRALRQDASPRAPLLSGGCSTSIPSAGALKSLCPSPVGLTSSFDILGVAVCAGTSVSLFPLPLCQPLDASGLADLKTQVLAVEFLRWTCRGWRYKPCHHNPVLVFFFFFKFFCFHFSLPPHPPPPINHQTVT